MHTSNEIFKLKETLDLSVLARPPLECQLHLRQQTKPFQSRVLDEEGIQSPVLEKWLEKLRALKSNNLHRTFTPWSAESWMKNHTAPRGRSGANSNLLQGIILQVNKKKLFLKPRSDSSMWQSYYIQPSVWPGEYEYISMELRLPFIENLLVPNGGTKFVSYVRI